MKSLWKQKKANKGLLTGSQKPCSVAINITPKILEAPGLFIEGLHQHLVIAWLLKPVAIVSVLCSFRTLLKRMQLENSHCFPGVALK